MGADMLLTICAGPTNLGLTEAEGLQRIIAYCATATLAEIECYFDIKASDSAEAAYEEEFGEPPTPVELLAETGTPEDAQKKIPTLEEWGRGQMKEGLTDAYKEVFVTDSRDVTAFWVDGMQYIATGGMSWGDDTESSGPMRLLDSTGIFDLPVRKGALDLSTAHVPEEMLEWVDLKVVHRCQNHEYGWIVFLGDKEEDKDSRMPDWFKPILRLARASNCRFVNFDRDGDTFDLLPVYTEVD